MIIEPSNSAPAQTHGRSQKRRLRARSRLPLAQLLPPLGCGLSRALPRSTKACKSEMWAVNLPILDIEPHAGLGHHQRPRKQSADDGFHRETIARYQRKSRSDGQACPYPFKGRHRHAQTRCASRSPAQDFGKSRGQSKWAPKSLSSDRRLYSHLANAAEPPNRYWRKSIFLTRPCTMTRPLFPRTILFILPHRKRPRALPTATMTWCAIGLYIFMVWNQIRYQIVCNRLWPCEPASITSTV